MPASDVDVVFHEEYQHNNPRFVCIDVNMLLIGTLDNRFPRLWAMA